jgi:hypothetical protein
VLPFFDPADQANHGHLKSSGSQVRSSMRSPSGAFSRKRAANASQRPVTMPAQLADAALSYTEYK